jgi:hypothetical protein
MYLVGMCTLLILLNLGLGYHTIHLDQDIIPTIQLLQTGTKNGNLVVVNLESRMRVDQDLLEVRWRLRLRGQGLTLARGRPEALLLTRRDHLLAKGTKVRNKTRHETSRR